MINAWVCSPCHPLVEQGLLQVPDADTRSRAIPSASAQPQPPLPPRRHHPAPDPSTGRPHPLARVAFHTEHHMYYKRGIAWCALCGAWTSGEHPKSVTDKCNTRPASGAGRDVLARIRKGQTPKPRQQWPLPEGVGPPAGAMVFVDGQPPALAETQQAASQQR